MHTEAIEAAWQSFDVDSIIKVFGIFAVDGDDRQVAQITAAKEFLVTYRIRNSVAILLYGRGKFQRQVVARDR